MLFGHTYTHNTHYTLATGKESITPTKGELYNNTVKLYYVATCIFTKYLIVCSYKMSDTMTMIYYHTSLMHMHMYVYLHVCMHKLCYQVERMYVYM